MALWATAGAAKDAEPIVIGQVLASNNNDVSAIYSIKGGAQAYVDEINAGGGIRGRKIQLISLTSVNDIKLDMQNFRSLVKDHNAVAILNCYGQIQCQAAARVAAELHVPLIGPMTGSRSFSRTSSPFLYRIRPTYEREAESLSKQLTAMGIYKVAILTSHPIDQEEIAALQQGLVNHGAKVTILPLENNDTPTLTALLGKLGSEKYSAAVMDVNSDTLDAIVKLGYETRDEWPTTLASTVEGPLSFLTAAFKNRVLVFSAVVPQPESSNTALVREFQHSVGAAAYNYLGLEAYVNTKICIEAIRRAGNLPDAEHLGMALDGMLDYDLGGFTVSFAHTRESASDWVDVGVRSRKGFLIQ